MVYMIEQLGFLPQETTEIYKTLILCFECFLSWDKQQEKDGIIEYRFNEDFAKFIIEYKNHIHTSRGICTDAQSHLNQFLTIVTFVKDPDQTLEAKKERVSEFLETSNTTSEDSAKLARSFTDLQNDIDLSQRLIDERCSNSGMIYRVVNNVAEEVNEYINERRGANPPIDECKQFKACVFDGVKPLGGWMSPMEAAWTAVWYDARLLFDKIKNAKDAATLVRLQDAINRAEQDFTPIVAALTAYLNGVSASEMEADAVLLREALEEVFRPGSLALKAMRPSQKSL